MAAVVYLSYANNPDDPKLVHLRTEKEQVSKALRSLVLAKKIILELEDNTEINSVFSRLNDIEYAKRLVIFGFSGHAGGGRLIFNDDEAKSSGLSNLMRKENCPFLKVVFLNGCVTSEHLSYFEENGVPIIITTNSPVTDIEAKNFSSTFFSRLAQGDPIYQAYLQAFGQIKTRNDVQERVRCYRNAGFEHEDQEPVWEFAYREERFKYWTLEMGTMDPPDVTFQIADANTTKILFFGEKYHQGISNRFIDKVETKDLTLVPLPLNSILNQSKIVKEAIEHTDIVVFSIHKDQADKVFRSRGFDWLPQKLKEKQLPVTFLREICSDQDLIDYQSKFSYTKPVVIPAYLDLHTIHAHDPSQVTNMICHSLEKEVLVPLKKKIASQRNLLLDTIEDFDLTEQLEYLGSVSRKDQINFIVLEGTAKCGLELLLKRALVHLSLKTKDCYRIKFDSAEGPIETSERLYAKLYAKITGKPERSVPKSKVSYSIGTKLEDGPVCIIFDNPLAVSKKELFLECWQTLIESFEAEESLDRFYFIVLNKATNQNGQLLLAEIQGKFTDSPVTPSIFPRISSIERKHFNTWWGRYAASITKYSNETNLDDQIEQILADPFLGSVLEQLCIHLNQPTLITEILPKYQ